MAAYTWSSLSNNAVLSFNPVIDTLTFDGGISAANIFIDSSDGSDTIFSFGGKSVTFLAAPYSLTSTSVLFANGSLLKIGDNNTSTAGDDGSNTIEGNSGNDMLIGAGGPDSLVGNGGNDVFPIVSHETTELYGNDTINGGGGGQDRIIYWDDNGFGVTVNLGNETDVGTAIGGDGNPGSTLTLIGIEAVTGTGNNDTFTANSSTAVNGLGSDIVQRFEGNGGNDTLNGATGNGRITIAEYTMSPSGVYINLSAGTASDGFGDNDFLNDEIDAVIGSMSGDTLVGGSESRSVNGGYFEFFEGRGGNDTIDGGMGTDRAQYDGSPSAVLVNLSNSQVISGALTVEGGNFSVGGHAADGFGGTDTLNNIEHIRGSGHNDTLVGSTWNDTQIEGRAGADSIVGGDELDLTRYTGSPFAAVVNLGTANLVGNFYGAGVITVAGGTARDGWDSSGSGIDTLLSIEGVRGSDFNDTLVGGGSGAYGDEMPGGIESFEGRAGADYINGVNTGGVDIADYRGDPHAVVVNLSASGVAVVDGGPLGAVTVAGGTALDGYWINTALGNATQGQRTDTLININGVEGSSFNDTLVGGSGNNHFQGNAGNDYIDGGADTDTVYFDGPYGVVVNLGADTLSSGMYGGVTLQGGTALDGENSSGGGTDTFFNIENAEGSEYNDFILGSTGANVLRGWDGSDTLVGGSRVNDTVSDTLIGDEADDYLRVSKGGDYLDGGTGGGDVVLFNNTAGNTSTNVTYSGAVGVYVDLGAGTLDYDTSDGANPVTTIQNIEAAWGTAGNDSMIGGSFARADSGIFSEIFRPGAGNDTIDGSGSGTDGQRGYQNRVEYGPISNADSVIGAVSVNLVTGVASDGRGGTDTLIDINVAFGAGGNDTLIGGNTYFDTFERFQGNGGNDYIDGGSGSDEASYQGATNSVNVTIDGALGTGGSTGADGTDTLLNIERVRGSNFNDSLIGGSGNEVFTGSDGNDTIDGGAGIDYASWSNADIQESGFGLYAYLSNAPSSTVNYYSWNDNHGSDTLINIEGLIGTSNNDTLMGGSGNQWFIGRGGDDIIDGGADIDTVDYSGDPHAVTVSLSFGDAQDGWGYEFNMLGYDTLLNIENVDGSAYNDQISGSAVANLIDGGSGNDNIAANQGNDTVFGGDGNDTIYGGEGNDTLDGGNGIDMLDYSASPNRVLVNMFTNDLVLTGIDTVSGGTARDGLGYTDTISNFENVIGTAFDDYIRTRSGSADVIQGGSGNDTLAGGGNTDTGVADTLVGGDGDDRLIQTLGADSISGGDGFDTLSFDSTISGGVTVNLSTGTSSVPGFVATISSIEQVFGNGGNDLFIGGATANAPDIFGNGQVEIFRGNDGQDTINGADGNGWFTRADYGNNTNVQAVNANLAAGTANDGRGSSDVLIDVDQVYGGAGNDTLLGGSYSRTSVGSFYEEFRGGAGNDLIDGNNDTVLGVQANDRVNYGNSTNAVIVNLGTNALTGTVYGTVNAGTARDGFDSLGGGVDTLISIDQISGSNHNDTLVGGNEGRQRLQGQSGNDWLVGGQGDLDDAGYDSSPNAVIVNLGTSALTGTIYGTVNGGTARDGFDTSGGGTDTLQNIEGARGSEFNDTIVGSNFERDEWLLGGAGNDYLDGGAPSAFGDEINIASYRSSNAGVSASVVNGTGTASDGFGGTDTLVNINGLEGSAFNDTLTGGAGDQDFMGRGGNDIIDGGDGALDIAHYYFDPTGVIVNLGAGSINVGAETIFGGTARDGWGGIFEPNGNETLLGGTDTLSNIEGVQGSNHNDTLVGNNGDNHFAGSGGNDYIDGGAGTDTVYFDGEYGAVINLGADTVGSAYGTVQAGTARDGEDSAGGGTDTLIGFENAEGSEAADIIVGSAGNNALLGWDGHDTIDGGAGNDTIEGEIGNDLLIGGTGIDVLSGGAGNDEFVFNVSPVAGNEKSVLDFSAGDTIGLDAAALTGLSLTGTLSSSLFVQGAGITSAQNSTQRIAYNTTTGDVYYDVDGAGGSAAVRILTLTSNGVTPSVIDETAFVVFGGSDLPFGATEGDDFLIGTTGADSIGGFGGNDTINALDGNDTLDGGAGADALYGGLGDDLYLVDTGDTVVENAASGIDTIRVGFSYGLDANVENLTLLGSSNLNAYGNELSNYLTGNTGNNLLVGLDGNDTLDGSVGGADVMYGGAGDDVYVVGTGDAVVENAASGIDTIQVGFSYGLDANVENLTLLGSSNLNAYGNELSNYLTGNTGNNLLVGLDGNDTLDGSVGGADVMYGGAGDDVYVVGTGDAVVENAASGIDTIRVGFSYGLDANVENLTLLGSSNLNAYGNELSNYLTGNTGNNLLVGLDGNDTLDGSVGGADVMYGGAGDDVYVVGTGDAVVENAASGIDTIRVGFSYGLDANVENLTLLGSSNLNAYGNELSNYLTGNTGNNLLVGLDGNDTLDGSVGGADVMYGGAGDDVYVVGTGDAVVENAASGIDTIQVGFSYGLDANVENLTLLGSSNLNAYGNELSNYLTGNTGNNLLVGLDGNDTLDGSVGGADVMYGGAGDDVYVVGTGDAVVENAASGIDTIRVGFSYGLDANVENLTLLGSSNLNAYGNELSNYLTDNTGNNLLVGLDGNDTLDGSVGGADVMYGGAGDDVYVVGTGDAVVENAASGIDTIRVGFSYGLDANVENLTLLGSSNLNAYGNELSNYLTGNTGNNLLVGLDGNDTLDGSVGGADVMYGGAGDDVYVVGTGDAVVENAASGIDTIQVGFSYGLDANVENLTLTGGSGTNAFGNELNNVLTGNTGNNTLVGLDGNDTLGGGAGADNLIGGAGNDTLVWDAADVAVAGGADIDALRVDGSGITLDLTVLSDSVITDIEVIDMAGSGNNTLNLALSDVLAISSSTDTLIIDGNAGDIVNAGTGWTDLGVVGAYHQYQQSTAILLVDEDMTRNIFA